MTIKTLAAFMMVAIAGSAWALPLGTDITISDQNSSGSGWYGPQEDNETEVNPTTLQGQEWDLEGMYLNNSALTLVGGYDFKNGVTYNGHNYGSGSIFVDVNGNAVYGQTANGGAPLGGTTHNTYGYDYALNLNYNTMTYNVVQLNGTVTLGDTTVVPSSNPWDYISGGTPVAGYQNVPFTYYSGLSNSDVGGLQGYNGNNTHYAIVVDTSFIAPGTLSTFHYTYECGNDNLMGQGTTPRVPDAGLTVAMLGLALAGIGALRRRLS